MASMDSIKRTIKDIAGRPRNVRYEEIDRIVRQLGDFYKVKSRRATHGTLFTVGNQHFMVSPHNPGSNQVKKYCVDDFIGAMVELGIYDD